jgi:hypothetical protein
LSLRDGYEHTQLRYRRVGGGYRREDVEFAIGELRLTLRRLDADLTWMRDRNHELEGELGSARDEIEAFRGKEEEFARMMAAALRGAVEIEEAANKRALEIVEEAKEAAMRIRAEATRRIEESGSQFNQLLRLKDRLIDAMRRTVVDFDQAIMRVERGEPGEPEAVAESRAERSEEEPATPPPPAPSLAAGPSLTPVPSPEPDPKDALFETRVELDAGPFSDFVALSAFERSLARLPEIENVHVRRLADERALIELTLSEPAPLMQTMRDSLPYSLELRSGDRSRLVVDVSARSAAGTR